MSFTSSTIRINKKTKEIADQQLKSMGLTFNAYVNMAVIQLLVQGRIPFDVKTPRDIPTLTTAKAIAKTQEIIEGRKAEDEPSFSDGRSLVKFLEKQVSANDEKENH